MFEAREASLRVDIIVRTTRGDIVKVTYADEIKQLAKAMAMLCGNFDGPIPVLGL